MPLTLLVGPANSGKVARLLDGYVEAGPRDPVLVVPNRADVERAERDLLARSPGLLGGSIGTFDDLFARIERARDPGEDAPRVIGDTQRALLLERVIATSSLNGLSASARFPGFAQTLGDAIADVESALLDPADLEGDLARLYAAYRAELGRSGLEDRELARRRVAERVLGDLAAWDGAPVFAYGFEDLTGVQWHLLEALAARSEVTVSLPYEPGRAVFASLGRTASDLAGLANGRIEELRAQPWYASPALAYLERALFEEAPAQPPPLDGSVRFLEAAGSRAALELVGDEVIGLLRAGTPAEEIAVVCPGLERWRAPLETAFGALEIPYAIDAPVPFQRTPLGRALLRLLRFAWLGGTRRDLFSFLRSPYSGLPRGRVDYVEGRLRGRAVSDPARVEEEATRLLGHELPALAVLRADARPLAAIASVAATMVKAVYGLDAPPVAEDGRLDLRAHEALRRLLAEVEGWLALGGDVSREQLVRALEQASVGGGPRAGDPGRVAVLELLRARTRRFSAVFLLGLEEGVLPRRSADAPFLSEEMRRELEERGRRRRLVRPDPLSRERYLFYTACTRAWRRLTLVREAAGEDGRPREPSPFYDEVRGLFAPDEVARWTRRRPLSALCWELDEAPTDRERLRATAALAAHEEAEARALARANGWERKIERALGAFARPTKLRHPAVLRELAETSRFSVTELETFGDCSSLWLFNRVVDPKAIDAELDPRLRGGVAHQALYRFYSGLPKRLGVEQVDAERLDDALSFLRECLAEAIAGQVRIELSEVERLELEGTLARDLEQFVRQELELGSPLVPRRFEVLFGTPGAPVELQRGLDLGGFTLSGKIDRVDVDPFSARGVVQDYKSGSAAHSAAEIESEGRLQIPLYILALRDLVGMEPLGGLYRALAGPREARGLARASAREDGVPGLTRADYLDEEEFWSRVERSKERARAAVERLRAGDVRHDPRRGACPAWCDRWTMCRIERP